MAELGFFGKIPAKGDFVRQNVADDAARSFEQWVQESNDALRAVGRDLGAGIASAVNLLNPQVVVLGGYFRSLYPLVRAEVDDTVRSRALVAPNELVRIALPTLGADSVLVGAAEVAFAGLLADPVAGLSRAQRDVEATLVA